MRRQYRRDLRRRRIWEARRRRNASRLDTRRKRRSLSLEHWIETLVVVDREMVKHYERTSEEEIERYVLTIINMVGPFSAWYRFEVVNCVFFKINFDFL